MVLMQVVLPAPLRPEQAEQPSGLQRKRHAVQHMAVAVEGVDAVDDAGRQSPR